MRQVNRCMHAARHLRDTDLIQDVKGHLVDSECNLVGLVVEAVRGRPVQLGDRTLVYEAVARLQRNGCVFAGINAGTLLIRDGRVCFADLKAIRVFKPHEMGVEFDEETERFHWTDLERLFTSLEEGIPPLPHYQLMLNQPVVILSNIFSPEKPLLATHVTICIRFLEDPESDEDFDALRRPMIPARSESIVFEMIRDKEEIIGTRILAYPGAVNALPNRQRSGHTRNLSAMSSSSSLSPPEMRRTYRLPATSSSSRRARDSTPYRSGGKGYCGGPTRDYSRRVGESYLSDNTSESGDSIRFEELY